MKILFAGTPEIAVPSLRAVAGRFPVVGVLTAVDTVSGRGKALTPPAVKTAAQELALPVIQPERLGTQAREAVKRLDPELLVCVAYGRIFGPRFLSLFPQGGLNLHPSLLPRHRGPSPIPAAILAGDEETGITIQKLAQEMDTGDILSQERLPLSGQETTGTLTAIAAEKGADLLVETLEALDAGNVEAVAQDHARATYSSIIEKSDGLLDWSLSSEEIDRRVRAYQPWPGAYTFLNGERLMVHSCRVLGEDHPEFHRSTGEPGLIQGVDNENGILVETGSGVIAVSTLQLQAKKPLDWKSFLNGHQTLIGTVLGE